MASTLDVQFARSQFPTLESGYVYADNAGGSQALKSVADATRDYLLYSNVQLGASYPASQRATGRVMHGADAASVIFNAASADEVAFGHSSTQMLANLAKAMAPKLRGDDEIIVTGEHEANVGPWKTLATSRTPPHVISTWLPLSTSPTNPYALSYNSSLSALLELITPRTRIVALSGCSNILGEMFDIETAVKAIRARKFEVILAASESQDVLRSEPASSHAGRRTGAEERLLDNLWIVVDLVAFAPHRCIDVRKWDVDFAVLSCYKLYGPHTAAMYTRSTALENIASIAHHFHSPRYDGLPVKLQPGGPGYELSYAAAAVLPYLYALSSPATAAGLPDSEELLRTKSITELRRALDNTSLLFEAHERALTEPLLAFLTSPRMYARGVRVVGPETCVSRAPTVSFVVIDGNSPGSKSMLSRDIVEQVDQLGTIGIRWGHFYAYTLVATLPNFSPNPPPDSNVRSADDGVVRISLVHYNTVGEVEKIIQALDDILSK